MNTSEHAHACPPDQTELTAICHRSVAPQVAPYGSIAFDKFADRSATQSQLLNSTIAEVEMARKAKTDGAVPVPAIKPTV